MSKTKKILFLAIILGIIPLIWLTKSSDNISQISDNSDFGLYASSLDLEKLKSYNLPMLIDFGADACIPCKEMAPILKELNTEYQGKVIIKFIDVWKNEDLKEGFPFELIPTQFLFNSDGSPYTTDSPVRLRLKFHYNDQGEHILTSHTGGMKKELMLKIFNEMGVK